MGDDEVKGKFLRIIALLTSLVMLFSLVACTGDKNDETTEKTTDTVATEIVTNEEGKTEIVTVDDKTGENSTTDKEDKTTDKNSDKTTSDKATNNDKTTTNNKTTNNNGTTKPTTKKTESAPVNGTVAEIVSFYNNAANRTKSRDFTANKKEQTTVIIDSLSSDSDFFNKYEEKIISLGNSVINRLTGKGKPVIVDEKFDKGKPTISDVSKNAWIPIMENSKMSTLTPDGVKSASCKKDGDGYIVTIVLKPEKGTLKVPPKHHAQCVNYLRLEALDLGIFSDNIKQAEMNYIDSTNSGTKFVAKINKNNTLDYFNTYMTIKGSGTGTLFGLTATAKLHGTYTAEIKFKW